MKTLLLQNVDLGSVNVSDALCGFKHDYQDPSSDECRGLGLGRAVVIIMLRNPYDWALAMHRRCWCGGEAVWDRMAALPFDQFLERPFVESSLKPWTGEQEMSPCGSVMQVTRLCGPPWPSLDPHCAGDAALRPSLAFPRPALCW
eukprot:352307-Chlamydomonas_euryale.AAC.2